MQQNNYQILKTLIFNFVKKIVSIVKFGTLLALYGERCTLRRKMHFKEKEALYGERCTFLRKMHFTEKDENNAD